MTSVTYRLPAELETRLRNTRADLVVSPPADGLMHEGKLNMGPAILLASTLSLGCWAIIISVGLKLFH